jgi:hypothetical protein
MTVPIKITGSNLKNRSGLERGIIKDATDARENKKTTRHNI